MRGGKQSRSGPSSGPTVPRATSTERLTGTSTHRAGVLYCIPFMASCILLYTGALAVACRQWAGWLGMQSVGRGNQPYAVAADGATPKVLLMAR